MRWQVLLCGASGLVSCAGGLAGCAGQSGQIATCQAEKEQLLTTIRNQRETTRALNSQVASLETRLDQAEKELASAGRGTRISTRPSETPPVPTKNETLPWRAPAGKAPKLSAADGESRTSRTAQATGKLRALAERDKRVQYDRAARVARVELPIGFRDGTATLTGEDKRQLDELSQLLKSQEARDMNVIVTGSAERGQAVADYLDRHGIARERLAVSEEGGNVATSARRGVEVYLLEPDVAVADFVPPGRLRR